MQDLSEDTVVFVIVTYKKDPESTLTLRSLADSLRQVPGLVYRVLVYDNSGVSNAAAPSSSVPNCTIYSSCWNRGLAKPYNDALRYCESVRASVLVTLDQDSRVTPEYLALLKERRLHLGNPVVALCPCIVAHDRVISPVNVDWIGRRHFGCVGSGASAVNSFSAYSVKFLQSVGGFDEFYWLDALDLATYAGIARRGMAVELMGVKVHHDLSLLSGSISSVRLVNIVYYEACFLFEYARPLQVAFGIVRLVVRAARVAPAGRRLRGLLAAIHAITKGGLTGLSRRLTANSPRNL